MSKGKQNIVVAPAIALIATLLSALPSGAADSSRPQLLLSIVVDGLRSDYLDLLGDKFGPDGFKRLLRDGVIIDELDYGTGLDRAGAVAMLYTGAEPSVSGIASALSYSTERHMALPSLLDPSVIGNYTDETLSPAALRVSTLADEVRIDGGGAGYVHSIAPDAATAILMAGHCGNSAFWINDANGNWATTTHYREVPTPVSARNFSSPLSARLDTICWSPLLPMDAYPALPAHKRHYAFRHTFPSGDADRFRRFKQSAPVNREITDMALEYARVMNLGRRDATDMLSLGYTLAPYAGTTDTDARLETMDAYMRLDRELARLLDALAADKNTVVLLTGVPARPDGTPDDPRWGLPSGQFSTRKAISLLNMYLIARHGNGEWVLGYHDGAFYLNHKLIDEKNLDAETLRHDAAKFLMRMSGIGGAYTIDDILEGRTSPSLRRNTVATSAPDVYISVLPGWTLLDDTLTPPSSHTVRATAAAAPMFILAPGRLGPGRIATPVDARRVAPTVSRLLRIRSPNGAAMLPLSEIFPRPNQHQ